MRTREVEERSEACENADRGEQLRQRGWEGSGRSGRRTLRACFSRTSSLSSASWVLPSCSGKDAVSCG